jgi:CRP/FNR family transcriptional regulator, cyclic AMP receptor protein
MANGNGKGKSYLAIANAKTQVVDWAAFLAGVSRGKTALEYGASRVIFVQGDPADSVWYLKHGEVKLAVTSRQGKEAIVSVLGANEFFGEGCLAGQPLRISTATAVTDCSLYRTLGFVDYAGNGALTVNNGLLSVVLSE